jgi:hypothetical protein
MEGWMPCFLRHRLQIVEIALVGRQVAFMRLTAIYMLVILLKWPS